MYLTRMQDFYTLTGSTTDAEKSEALLNYNEILLKAIESNEILQSWMAEEVPSGSPNES